MGPGRSAVGVPLFMSRVPSVARSTSVRWRTDAIAAVIHSLSVEFHSGNDMHIKQHGSNRYIALLIGIIAIAAVGVANADPPARVARLGYVNGPVSFSPAGDDDWVQAGLNRPLVTGDRLWADAGARTELQMGSAAIRLRRCTSVTLLNLDDRSRNCNWRRAR